MKKYIAPAVEINETETIQMMALSLQNGSADGSDVLTNEENDWNTFSDDAQIEE